MAPLIGSNPRGNETWGRQRRNVPQERADVGIGPYGRCSVPYQTRRILVQRPAPQTHKGGIPMIQSPRLPRQLEEPSGLRALADRCREEERVLTGGWFRGEDLRGAALDRLEVRGCRFTACTFAGADLEGASFVDVEFCGCDLSNTRLADAYLERCALTDCKCVGLDGRGGVWKQTALRDCAMGYAALDKARLSHTALHGVELTGATLSQVRLQGIELEDCTLVRNNLFQTPLAGVDLTRCTFSAPTLSQPPEELRSAKVSREQAADLLRLWGVLVEE